MGDIHQDTRVVRVVLHDQQGRTTRHQVVAVVGNLQGRPLPDTHRGHQRRAVGRRVILGLAADAAGARGAEVGHRQVERERAAAARSAAQLDLSAEQRRQLAADGQAQPGAAVLAAGAGIGLLECLEDDALFFGRNADAGVRDLEGDHVGRTLENRVIGAPPGRHA